jgi:hypothetical protein
MRLRGSVDTVWGQYADSHWRLGSDKYAVGLHLPISSLEWRGLTEEAWLAFLRLKAAQPKLPLESITTTIYGASRTTF